MCHINVSCVQMSWVLFFSFRQIIKYKYIHITWVINDFVVICSSVLWINPEIWRWEKHVQQRNLLLIICPEWSRRCGVGESKYLPLHCSVRNIFWILVFCGFSHNFVLSVFTFDFCPVGHLKGEGASDCPIIKFATQIEMEKLKDCFNVLFNFASSPHSL